MQISGTTSSQLYLIQFLDKIKIYISLTLLEFVYLHTGKTKANYNALNINRNEKRNRIEVYVEIITDFLLHESTAGYLKAMQESFLL